MRPPMSLDAAFAAVLAVGGLTELAVGASAGAVPVPAVAAVLVGASAMLLRTRAPLAGFGLAALLVAVSEVPSDGVVLTASMVLGLLVALGSVAQRCPLWVGVAAAAGTFAVFGTVSVLGERPWDVVAMLLGTGTAWGIGRLVHREQERNAELAGVVAELALEREARADEAVRVERGRIARELHDAVAHIVSVMTLHAGGVRRRLDVEGNHDRETEVLREVEDLGREAVTELHRAVGVLRSLAADPEPAGDHGLAPPPRLRQVEQLAERFRATGLAVDLRVEGEPRTLPGGLDLAAYRIVQEALTNALKHAGPTRADVVVRYDDAELTVSVADDGSGGSGGPGGPPGHGLTGMRERVSMYGGELETGADPAGGWSVRARLPAPRA